MSEAGPLVSIVTACYASERFLERTYRSICAQGYRPLEWVAVDDASPDGTRGCLERYRDEHRVDVRLVPLDVNVGPVEAIRRGIEAATGEFVLILDHDDELVPDGVQTLVRGWLALEPTRRAGLSGVGGRCVDPDGRVIGSPLPSSPWITNELAMRFDHRVAGELTGMVRTEILRRYYVGLERGMTNGIVWRRIARHHDAVYLDEPVRVYHRDVATSMTNTTVIANPGAQRRQLAIDLNENLDYLRRQPVTLARTLLHYLRYSRYDRATLAAAREALTSRWLRSLATVAWPASAGLVVLDRWRGRTVR